MLLHFTLLAPLSSQKKLLKGFLVALQMIFRGSCLTRKFLHADIQKNSFGRSQSMPISAFKKSLTSLLEVGTLFMEAYKSLK